QPARLLCTGATDRLQQFQQRLSRTPAQPFSRCYPPLFHKRSTSLSPSSEQPLVVPQDHLRGVVAGGAGDAAAGMGAGAAMIEALERSAVIGMAQHRAGGEQLVQRQRAMEDIPTQKPEFTLQIERRE